MFPTPILTINTDHAIGHSVEVYTSLPSTNTFLMQHASKSTPTHGTAIVAYHQGQGRGQIGRQWESEPRQNLLISYFLRPQFLAIEQQFLLNYCASLAVHDLLSQEAGLEAAIKWPNDIYVEDHKIAGILTQCSIQGSKIQHAALGIGLNVNQTTWPSTLPNPTSIKAHTGKTYDLLDLAMHLSRCLSHRYQILEGPRKSALTSQYVDLLYRKGQWSDYKTGGKISQGQLTGIDDQGRAVIQWSDGSTHAYRFGEVSLVV